MEETHIFMGLAMLIGSMLTVYPIMEIIRSASALDTRHYSIFSHVGALVSAWTWGLACHQQASCEDIFFFYNMWVVLFEIGLFISFVSICKKRDDKTRAMVWAMPISICMLLAFGLWLATDLRLVKGLTVMHSFAASFGIFSYMSGIILLKWPCNGWLGAGRREHHRRPLPNTRDYIFLLFGIADAMFWALYALHTPSFIFEVQAWLGVALLTWQLFATIFVRWSRIQFSNPTPANPVRTFSTIVIETVKEGCTIVQSWVVNTWGRRRQMPQPMLQAATACGLDTRNH